MKWIPFVVALVVSGIIGILARNGLWTSRLQGQFYLFMAIIFIVIFTVVWVKVK